MWTSCHLLSSFLVLYQLKVDLWTHVCYVCHGIIIGHHEILYGLDLFFLIFFHQLYLLHEPYSRQREFFMLAVLPYICHLHFWLKCFCFVTVILFGKSAVHRSFAVADNLGEVSAKAQVLQYIPFRHFLSFFENKVSWFLLVFCWWFPTSYFAFRFSQCALIILALCLLHFLTCHSRTIKGSYSLPFPLFCYILYISHFSSVHILVQAKWAIIHFIAS